MTKGAFAKWPLDMATPVQTPSRDSRDPELSLLLKGPCHSDWSHCHKRLRCDCYTIVFIATVVAASVRWPALNLILHYFVFADDVLSRIKVVACMMALVPELFQIQLWNWRIAKRFGTSSSRVGYGNRRLRTETLEKNSEFRKKYGIFAPLKPPRITPQDKFEWKLIT